MRGLQLPSCFFAQNGRFAEHSRLLERTFESTRKMKWRSSNFLLLWIETKEIYKSQKPRLSCMPLSMPLIIAECCSIGLAVSSQHRKPITNRLTHKVKNVRKCVVNWVCTFSLKKDKCINKTKQKTLVWTFLYLKKKCIN